MINNRTLSSSATMAISAVLALVSTPAFAQVANTTAAPVAAAAEPSAPTPSAPTIVIPDVTAPPAQIAPTPQEVAATPVEEAPVAAPAARTTTREAAPRAPRPVARTAAPVADAAPVAAIPAARTITPAAAPALLPPESPIAQPAARPASTDTITPATENANWALPLGALVLVGIGGIVFASSRRRRVMRYDVADPEANFAATSPEPAFKRDVVLEPVATPVVTPPSGTRFANLSPADLAEDGPVPTGEAREALLARMVAAAPDAANPFKSPQGRRRRARLILQARENRWAERLAEQPAVTPVRREQAAPVRAPQPEYA